MAIKKPIPSKKRKARQTEAVLLVEALKHYHLQNGHGALTNTDLAGMCGYAPTNMSNLLQRSSAGVTRFLRSLVLHAKNDNMAAFVQFDREAEFRLAGITETVDE